MGTLGHHVPAMPWFPAPAMPAFPPNPSQPARRAPATAAAGSSQSHAKSKKKAPNKRRRSKAATSSDEEASSPSEDSNSDSTNSGTSESAPGAGSVTHPLRHKHAKKQRSADSEVQGVMSRQDEEEFYEALTKFWGKQGSGGKRILAKYQPFESMRLTSGMPTFGAHHYWAAVMGIGGHNMVTIILMLPCIVNRSKAGPHVQRGGGGHLCRECMQAIMGCSQVETKHDHWVVLLEG